MTMTRARRGDIHKTREWFDRLQPRFEPRTMADTPRDLYDEAVALLGALPEAVAVPT